MRLPGIGAVRAVAIVAERKKKRFQSVDDLSRVPGIKRKIIDTLRPYVFVGDDEKDQTPDDINEKKP
jgi:DNA uptake protein ComE-like DNA-binding protein